VALNEAEKSRRYISVFNHLLQDFALTAVMSWWSWDSWLLVAPIHSEEGDVLTPCGWYSEGWYDHSFFCCFFQGFAGADTLTGLQSVPNCHCGVLCCSIRYNCVYITVVAIWTSEALFTGCPSCLMYKQGKPACLSTYNIGLLLHLKSWILQLEAQALDFMTQSWAVIGCRLPQWFLEY